MSATEKLELFLYCIVLTDTYYYIVFYIVAIFDSLPLHLLFYTHLCILLIFGENEMGGPGEKPSWHEKEHHLKQTQFAYYRGRSRAQTEVTKNNGCALNAARPPTATHHYCYENELYTNYHNHCHYSKVVFNLVASTSISD